MSIVFGHPRERAPCRVFVRVWMRVKWEDSARDLHEGTTPNIPARKLVAVQTMRDNDNQVHSYVNSKIIHSSI